MNAIKFNHDNTGFSVSEKYEILNELPNSLKFELSLNMHRGVLQRFNFF
jgi:hypothetical protein